MANTVVKTPIVYYGGKTGIMNHILPLVPVHENYCEEFAGGAALFFAKKPAKNETINDRLKIVVNFYRTLKLRYRPLKRLIDSTLIGRDIHNEGLEVIRAHKRGEKVDSVRLAWAFWVCTNFAFSNKIGGGYKYSNDMSVSVPDTLAKRKAEFTEALVARIEHAYIENDDALKVARSRNTMKTFHYFDPPYPDTYQGHYSGKGLPGGDKFGWSEYEQLLMFCATECTGKFLLSGYNSEMLERFINEFGWYKLEIEHKVTPNHPTRFSSRKTKVEVLVRNYATSCGTLKLFDPHSFQ